MADLTQQALDSAKSAAGQFNGISAPGVTDLTPDQYAKVGTYTPAQQQAFNLAPSQVSQIQEDPSLRAAQMKALMQMSAQAGQGLGPQDTAAMNAARMSTQGQMQQQAQALGQQAQQQNATGAPGGANIAALLQLYGKGQDASAANNASILGQSQARGLQALTAQGQMAGQVRGQDFSNAMAKAQAADAVTKANIQNQQNVLGANVSANNAGQQANLGESQSVADANLANQRAELTRQQQQAQQSFNDQLGLANAKSNALQGLANTETKQAGVQQQGAANVGAGATSAFSSLAKYLNSNNSDNTAKSSQPFTTSNASESGDNAENWSSS